VFDGLIDYIEGLQSPVGTWEAIVIIGFSLMAAIVAYLMYEWFYGSRHIGAGVHRTFILGGPAITTLFLGIQTSIPLSLGLLGALSFVRFRTPVKDPAEIGFLLLLIASSIGAATENYVITIMLFVLVFVSLSIQRLTREKFTLSGRGSVMISVDQPSFRGFEKELSRFLSEKLRGLTLETMSVVDGRVSLQYQYRRQTGFDWPAFTNDLNQLAGDTKVEIFVG
jgi:hypothetical protein